MKALFRNPGLVRAVHYRPSIRTQFEARARPLGLELETALEARPEGRRRRSRRRSPRPGASRCSTPRWTWSTSATAGELIMGEDARAAGSARRCSSGARRSPVPSAPLVVPVPDERRPEHGHGSLRAGLAGGASGAHGVVRRASRRGSRSTISATRPTATPLRAAPVPPGAAALLPEPRRLELDDLSLVKIVSLNPVSRWDHRPSWRMRAGATTVRDAGCDGCLAGVAEFGGGLGAMDLGRALDVVALGDTELLGAPGLDGIGGAGVRLGLGPAALVRVRAGEPRGPARGGALALPSVRDPGDDLVRLRNAPPAPHEGVFALDRGAHRARGSRPPGGRARVLNPRGGPQNRCTALLPPLLDPSAPRRPSARRTAGLPRRVHPRYGVVA